jgi:hypothetical protein
MIRGNKSMPSPRKSTALTDTKYNATTLDAYRQRARDLYASSRGVLRYVLDIFGPDLIGSIAFAIDPFRETRNVPVLITRLNDPPQHTRSRILPISGYKKREASLRITREDTSYTPDLATPDPIDYLFTGPVYSSAQYNYPRTGQEPLQGLLRDSTQSKRQSGYTMGEFELFVPKFSSRGRTWRFLNDKSYYWFQVGPSSSSVQRLTGQGNCTVKSSSPDMYCTNASLQLELVSAQNRASAALIKHAHGLFERCIPSRKEFRLAYQVAELKDLPQTLRGTLETWKLLERAIGKAKFLSLVTSPRTWRDESIRRQVMAHLGHVLPFPNDPSNSAVSLSRSYLTFKFGYESMVRAVMQFVPSPERIAKHINRFIERNGKKATFRSQLGYRDEATGGPSIGYDLFPWEILRRDHLSGHRDVNIRCVANFSIDFPDIDTPKFRSRLMTERLGVYPSPSDLYDLIPWTWLIDWFSGLGDYIHLMDTITSDHSLFNWGLITYKERSVYKRDVTCHYNWTESRVIQGAATYTGHTETLDHSGTCTVKYQLRRVLQDVSSLKSYWSWDSLSPTQAAILSALAFRNRV